MTHRRFSLGLALLGFAVLALVAVLALEEAHVRPSTAGTVAWLIGFSALQLAGVGLLWSDLDRRPLRWVLAIGASLVVLAYHLILLNGPS